MSVTAAPVREISVLIINDAFSFYAQAMTDGAKTTLAEYLPDRQRERDGRLFLGGFVELGEFQAWARARGLLMATRFRE